MKERRKYFKIKSALLAAYFFTYQEKMLKKKSLKRIKRKLNEIKFSQKKK